MKDLINIDNTEHATNACLNAFGELLRNFEIRQTQDLISGNLTITLSCIEISNLNEEKFLWLNTFFENREKIIKLLKKGDLLKEELL